MAAADQKPYVGPRPFGRDEKDLFFGRDREARDLCSLVVAIRSCSSTRIPVRASLRCSMQA